MPDVVEMKDWPHQLRESCAAATLAKAIYFARCEAWSVPAEAWEDLSWPVKQGLFEVAHRTLDALKPEPERHFGRALFTYATTLAREAAHTVARSSK